MILNLPTMLLLFLCGLVGLLAGCLALASLALLVFPGVEEIPGEPPPGWRRRADAALQAGARVAALLVLLGWPLLYVTLQSYVHRIPGAMCIYGVTQIAGGFVHGAEAGWPISLFAVVLFLVLSRVDRDTPGSPNRHRNRAGLLLAAGVLAVTVLQTVRYLLASKAGAAVSCCTTTQDLAPGPGFFQYLGLTRLEQHATVYPFFGATAGLTLLLALAGAWGSRLHGWLQAVLGLLLAGASLVVAMVMLEAMYGSLSPVLLGLPFHHCFYCLLFEFIDAPVFIAASLAGTISTLLAAGVATMADPATSAPARRWVTSLWRSAALLLGSSLGMILLHWLMAKMR